jgi:endonuclease/exonuclease/phosphatase (EEP) superfamily protein YafD
VLAALAASDRPLVVVGDFNATPEVVGMPAEYVDAWAVAGRDGAGLTSGPNTDLTGDHALRTRIDYVWVRGADVTDCRVVGGRPQDRTASGLWPSDHAGVVAELTF